jgi:hypothetical protein
MEDSHGWKIFDKLSYETEKMLYLRERINCVVHICKKIFICSYNLIHAGQLRPVYKILFIGSLLDEVLIT